ncbi:archaellin/type IV pilin N-terminal domain-containing protein [Geoglobus acetivorans]|uniref:Flagellin n=1 Tax=Geoglobus acetivorans TaxID=565033 RepID=A0ABZ3H543_GEOAI|nr:flagellin [Geoglobus acetivorans]
MSWKKLRKNEKGFTGLEAAIVLIAFVTVAAVFSYVMLGAGFYTTQKGKQSVDTGVKQASSSMELDGQYVYLVANTTGSSGDVKEIYYYITLSAGATPIDLNNTVVALRYQDYYLQLPYNATTKYWTYQGIVDVDGGTPDNLLEKNEKYKITINITALQSAGMVTNLPATNDYVTIEMKPPIGAPLIVNKQIPPSLTSLTWV